MWRERLTRARDTLVRWVQAVLITILLTLTYFVGFGLTALCLLPQRLLGRAPAREASCWLPATGDDLTEEGTSRQS